MAAKRIVGIFADYNASEKTLGALYFASHISKKYRHVLWVVPESVTPKSQYIGFSHQWDTEVLPLRGNLREIKKRIAKCEIFFFFDENEELYSLLPPRAKTAILLDPYNWDPNTSKSFAKKCTHALSIGSYTMKKVVKPNLLSNDLFFPFDPAIQIIPRPQIQQSGQNASVFYSAYGTSFLERQCIKQVADIVKECCPAIKSVVCYYLAGTKPEQGVDSNTYDWRLFNYLTNIDWIVDLNTKPLLGFFAAFAGALGVQWSCFDIPPNTESYNAARQHLIPYPEGGLILENAEFIAEHLVRHFTTMFNTDLDRNRNVAAYNRRFERFNKSVNYMLGIKGSKHAPSEGGSGKDG